MVASSLIMLCAQRLCRKLCIKCRKPIDAPERLLQENGFIGSEGLKEKITFFGPVGCKYCNNTGFYGRIAILEAIMIDDTLREMIIKKKSLDEIKAYATKSCGMKFLRDDAFLKVKEGITTIEEAIRITTEE